MPSPARMRCRVMAKEKLPICEQTGSFPTIWPVMKLEHLQRLDQKAMLSFTPPKSSLSAVAFM